MRILIANDDGVYSPGLEMPGTVAARFGEVRVVAPDVEQSAMGHAISIQRPLKYHRTRLADFEAYRVNGTPADCVALGLYHWDGADLVLSGINLGSNLGHDVWHSGTVAAAKQAKLHGVRAAAFSLALNGSDPDFDAVLSYVEDVIRLLLEFKQPFLVNVNLPQHPIGLCWTRQSVREYNGWVIDLWRSESGEKLQTFRRDRPYERLDIAGIKGLTDAQKLTLRMLGAVEEANIGE